MREELSRVRVWLGLPVLVAAWAASWLSPNLAMRLAILARRAAGFGRVDEIVTSEEYERQTDEERSVLIGVIVALRGPYFDGYREIDIRKSDGEIVTLELSPEQFAERTGRENCN